MRFLFVFFLGTLTVFRKRRLSDTIGDDPNKKPRIIDSGGELLHRLSNPLFNDHSISEEMGGNPTRNDAQPGGANSESESVRPPSESHSETAIASLILDNPSDMAGIVAGPSSPNNSLAEDSSNLIHMVVNSSNIANDADSPNDKADSSNIANKGAPSNMADKADSSNMANEAVSSNMAANEVTSSDANVPLSFRALDESGDEDEVESGISDMSDSESEEDVDGNLPAYPSDTDEDAEIDKDRRAFAEKQGRNPELKPGEYQ